MPKAMSPALIAHLGGDSITVCLLWRVALRSGKILAFTDLDRDVLYDDGRGPLLYVSTTGFNPSAVESTSELSVDNSEIQGILDDEFVTEQDIRGGLWDGAEVWIYRVNYRDLSMGHEVVNRGTIGNISTGRLDVKTEIRGLTQRLQQQSGTQVQPTCVAFFGDSKCKKNLADYTFQGSVTSVASRAKFGSDLDKPIGFFAKGKIKWLSGANQGLEKDVKFFAGAPSFSKTSYTGTVHDGFIKPPVPDGKSFAQDYGVIDSNGQSFASGQTPSGSGTYQIGEGGVYYFNTADDGKTVTITYAVQEFVSTAPGQFDLQLQMPHPIQVGDTFEAVAGCDKLLSTCKKFNNVINFRGFPHLPGRDALTGGPK